MGHTLLNATNCPHLILGVPSNLNSQDVVAAFARASKRVKSNTDAPFTIEDLTTALSEIESLSRTEESDLKYAIPANCDVLDKLASFNFDSTTLTGESDLSEVDVTKIDVGEKAKAGHVYLIAAIKELLLWNWQQASVYSRNCLRLSVKEDERDEALNVLAASLAAQGDATKALDALKKAVEGEWNLALQANLALIATEEDPSLAVRHMSLLVEGAKHTKDQIRACRTAIHIWQNSQSEETGSDDIDDFEPPPRVFLDSIQTILRNPEISEEIFYDFGKFLARVDSEAFSNSNSLNESPHSSSPSGQLVKLRLNGFNEYFGKLVKVASGCKPVDYPWIHDEVDQFVRSINQGLREDVPELSHLGMAFAVLSDGLDCSNRSRILLRILLVGNLHISLKDDDQPSVSFIKWIEEAQIAVIENDIELDEDDILLLSELLANSGNYLAHRFYYTFLQQGEKVEETSNIIVNLMSTFSGRRRANKHEIGESSGFIIKWCDEVVNTLTKVLVISNDDELETLINRMVRSVKTIKSKQLNL